MVRCTWDTSRDQVQMGSHFTTRALTVIFGLVSRQGSATDKKLIEQEYVAPVVKSSVQNRIIY